MTERADMTPGANGFRRVSYTCRCRFVDWGHASSGNESNPNSIAALKTQILRERGSWPGTDRLQVTLNEQPAFVVTYGQSMCRRLFGFVPLIGVSTMRHFVVRRGLSIVQRQRVALAIFQQVSVGFETLQADMGLSSGFSAEDLTSNVIGFHAAFAGRSVDDMRRACGEVGVPESQEVWDKSLGKGGLGAAKNRRFEPRLFPCKSCDNRDKSLPPFLTSLQPIPPGSLWFTLRDRFIDGTLVNSGAHIAVDSTGGYRLVAP